jgi:hypothetical protein
MSLTAKQREFLVLFVSDGMYDLMTTCSASGVLPSEAHRWFADDAFQAAKRKYEAAQLSAMGYGPLRTMRDIHDIAHSDISEVQAVGGDLSSLPRRVRNAIKKVKFKTAVGVDGVPIVYPCEVEMHDKSWALKQLAEWYDVANTPEVAKTKETEGDDNGPKRIAGLVVRPPLTSEERDIEDILS